MLCDETSVLCVWGRCGFKMGPMPRWGRSDT